MAISLGVTIVGLALLIGAPLAVRRASRRLVRKWRWALIGATIGALAPLGSLFLYLHFYMDPVRGALLGWPGFFLLVHWAPFMSVDRTTDAIARDLGTALDAMLGDALLRCVLLWTIVYGLIGFLASLWILPPEARPPRS